MMSMNSSTSLRLAPERFCKRAAQFAASLRADCSGLAMVEFAFTAPIILSLGLMGSETAYYTVTHMEVSQLAMQVADNASRVGENDVLVNRKIYEDDVIEVFIGAEKLGQRLNIFDQGRIVVSSLEMNDDGGQWIHWQRCRGAKNYDSKWGSEGDGENGTGFNGMGTPRIRASSGTAVMFVEVSYTYESLTPFDYLDGNEIEYTAAFNVRDQRDLTQIYASNSGATPKRCNVYTAD